MIKRPTLAPFAAILPLIVGGILLSERLGIEVWVSGIVAVLCIVGALVCRHRHPIGDIYIAAGVVFFAMTTTTLRQTPSDLDVDTSLTTTATITSTAIPRGRWNECDATIEANGTRYKVLLRTDTALVAPSLGQRGVLKTMVRQLPDNGYGRLMSRRGYSASCYTRGEEAWQPTDHSSSATFWAQRCQQRMVERVDRLELTPDQAAVVKAMSIGWRSDMSRELKSGYSRSGCAHLLALSGLHVGIVSMLVWALLWFMPLVGSRGHIWRCLLSMGVMLGYAVVTGMSPSVMRATLMFCAAKVGFAVGSTRTSAWALCGALSLMLLIRPNNLFDISFQLSAGAVVGILAAYKTLRSKLMTSCVPLNAMVATILIGLCSIVATLPLVAHTYGMVGVVGVAANPVVILTANILVLGTLGWSILPIEPLRGIVSWGIGNVAHIQNKFVAAISAIEHLKIEVTLSSEVVVSYYVLIIGTIAWWCFGKDRTKWIALNLAY